ncbi:MAG TPA: hypothetical protein VI456_12190 [Polyangia bacterium]
MILTAPSCAETRMVPTTPAHVVPGAPETAAAEIAALRISADGGDWTAAPTGLSKRLTPLKVPIVNHSGFPALITYGQFTLVDTLHPSDGFSRIIETARAQSKPIPLYDWEGHLLAGGRS